MKKSLLIAAAVLLTAPSAWAQVANSGPQGSTGGNAVGSAFTAPPTANSAGASASSGVQNGGPAGSAGGNNVGTALAPAPAATTAAAPQTARQVQNGGPDGSNGANNVGAAVPATQTRTHQ